MPTTSRIPSHRWLVAMLVLFLGAALLAGRLAWYEHAHRAWERDVATEGAFAGEQAKRLVAATVDKQGSPADHFRRMAAAEARESNAWRHAKLPSALNKYKRDSAAFSGAYSEFLAELAIAYSHPQGSMTFTSAVGANPKVTPSEYAKLDRLAETVRRLQPRARNDFPREPKFWPWEHGCRPPC